MMYILPFEHLQIFNYYRHFLQILTFTYVLTIYMFIFT